MLLYLRGFIGIYITALNDVYVIQCIVINFIVVVIYSTVKIIF